MDELSHFNEESRARMVDVTEKPVTTRTAKAEAFIQMEERTLTRIREGSVAKGDVLAVAQVAGILAAKKTHELIPMCHPIALTSVDLSFAYFRQPCGVRITATTRCKGETGVEMEALTAASVAALTIYDMCKAMQRDMSIHTVRLLAKDGGKSGKFTAGDDATWQEW